MSDKMKIDVAMAQLEAGKFSFQMVDAIKEHVTGLESEMEALRACHADALTEIKRQEFANWRLEAEARKLNARIHALLKANAISEAACREAAALSVKLRKYFDASARVARPALERAIGDIKAGRPQAELARISAAFLTLVKERAPTEQEVRDMIAQLEPHLDAFKKRVAPSVEKMMAYVSNLKKTLA